MNKKKEMDDLEILNQQPSMYAEIHEQANVTRTVIEKERSNILEIAEQLHTYKIRNVVIAARGTSDNAARYAQYLFGVFNQLPVALATPSLFSIYNAPPQMENALVIGISQSGQSPDIVQVLEEANRQGLPTLAITNEIDSPLALAANFVIDIRAGQEKAVAATKTYTAQMTAIALLSVALEGSHLARMEALRQLPDLIKKTLEEDDRIAQIAHRYRYMDHCVVLGRGFNYSTAFEWSLKMKELTYVVAEPYSSADFLHGPIAMVAQGFPVMAIAPAGAVYPEMLKVIQKLRNEFNAELLVISDKAEALALSNSPIEIPTSGEEWLTPIIGIVAAQLFCYHLTKAKGFDTEKPRGLNKVTLTK
jgi:glucosamine--fructose-6-phosphate aminotransferase (isomerizing)